ncbi:MAG: hypothetical protein WCA29_05635 [Jiangellales bacterium]
MVQAIENWASVTGAVRGVVPSDKGPDWRVLVLDVGPAQIDDLEGWPNLVRGQVGDDHLLAVTVREAQLDESIIAPGQLVRCRARLAAPGQVMAHPDGLGRA